MDLERDRTTSQATNGAARRRRHEADLVILELLRLVSAESWTPRKAGDLLRRRAPDESVLRLARVRVARALAKGPSIVAQRAAATLDAALAGPPVGRRLAPPGAAERLASR